MFSGLGSICDKIGITHAHTTRTTGIYYMSAVWKFTILATTSFPMITNYPPSKGACCVCVPTNLLHLPDTKTIGPAFKSGTGRDQSAEIIKGANDVVKCHIYDLSGIFASQLTLATGIVNHHSNT